MTEDSSSVFSEYAQTLNVGILFTVCPRMFASDKKIVLYLASLKMSDYD